MPRRATRPDEAAPPALALTPVPAGLRPPQLPGTPRHGRAAWLDPPSIAPAALPDGGWRARYRGPVRGAWGGRCHAQGTVTTWKMRFHAELRLHAGDAIQACLRGGGHGLDWVCIDDPDAGTGCTVPADLHLWLGAELRSPPSPLRGWRGSAGGGAFVGSEDGERRPIGLRLPLDPRQRGPLVSRSSHRLQLPNRCWALLPSRFVAGIHTHLDQALHWVIDARLRLAPAGGGSVRVHMPAAPPRPATAAAAPPAT